MGLFEFIRNIASAAIKVVTTSIAAIVDITSVSVDIETTNTKKAIESIEEGLSKVDKKIMS